MEIKDLKFYLVRNSSGQYYRRVGYGGYGGCWTDDAESASIWTKLSTARARVSYFANNYPEYPAPDLIEIGTGEITVLDEKDRIEKAKAKKKKAKEERELRQKKWAFERAQEDLRKAEANLKKLRGES